MFDFAYAEFAPAPALRRFVECYWSLSAPEMDGPHKILPNGTVEIVFNQFTPIVQREPCTRLLPAGSAVVVGQQMSYHRFEGMNPGPVDVFGVRFQPAGVATLFGLRQAASLTGTLRNLADLAETPTRGGRQSSTLAELAERMADTGPGARQRQRISILDHCLVRALDPRPLDVNQERIEYVVRRLRMSGGRDRIAELCEATNLGQRRLERLFKERVGLTPKYFARVMRLRRAFELLYTSPASYSLENVLDFGYYDQAHFIHDFHHFAGEAPRAFLGRPQYLNACFD